MSNPHEPTDACADEHCFTHNVDESAIGAYKVCVECGHAYRTREELVEEYKELANTNWTAFGLPDIGHVVVEIPRAEQIYFCPLCSSDF